MPHFRHCGEPGKRLSWMVSRPSSFGWLQPENKIAPEPVVPASRAPHMAQLGSSEAVDLAVCRPEKSLRGGKLREVLGRREALDRRRQHGVRIGVAMGRAVKL